MLVNETFECDGCGACCRAKLVDVFEEDTLREPKVAARMSPLREPGIDGEIGYLNCLSEPGCAFLDSDNRCGIYPTRPVVCVLFPAGGQACQDVRRDAGLPSLPPISQHDGDTAS